MRNFFLIAIAILSLSVGSHGDAYARGGWTNTGGLAWFK